MAAWVNFLYHSECYYRQCQWTAFCQMLPLWAMCNSRRNDSEDWDDFEEMEEKGREDGKGGGRTELWSFGGGEGGAVTGREEDREKGRTGKRGEAGRESRRKRWGCGMGADESRGEKREVNRWKTRIKDLRRGWERRGWELIDGFEQEGGRWYRAGGDFPLENLGLIELNTDAISGASLSACFLVTIFILYLWQ